MVRTKTVVYAKPGTVSRGGLNYTPRKTKIKPVRRQRRTSMLAEKKFLDTAIASTSISNTGIVFNSVNLIPQGTTDVTRIGNKVNVTNFNMHLTLQLPNQAIATPFSEKVRMIAFVDKQANGAAAVVTDILETANIHSFRNLDNTDRFQILKDEITHLDIQAVNPTVPSNAINQETVGINKKMNLPLHFSGTTGAITELRSNNIGFLFISLTGTIATVEGTARVKFVDL